MHQTEAANHDVASFDNLQLYSREICIKLIKAYEHFNRICTYFGVEEYKIHLKKGEQQACERLDGQHDVIAIGIRGHLKVLTKFQSRVDHRTHSKHLKTKGHQNDENVFKND